MPPRRRPPRAGALNDTRPGKLALQILALQVAYYLSALILMLFTSLVAGERFRLDLVLDWKSVRGDTAVGWTRGLCWLMVAGTCVIFLLLIVIRSKLVLDFALTLHFINLVVTSFYTRSLPSNLLWWMLQTASSAIMIFLGVWACQWRELTPLAFGAKPKDTTKLPSESGSGAEDSWMSFPRRGRGRGGAGVYEMVPIAEESV